MVSLVINTDGPVSSTECAYLRQKLVRVQEHSSFPVTLVQLGLSHSMTAGHNRAATATAVAIVDGRRLEAVGHASSMFAAIDMLETRLRQQLQTPTDTHAGDLVSP